MNWLAVVLWITPLAVLGLIGKMRLMATQPKPPPGRPGERTKPAIVKPGTKPTKDTFFDSAVIGAVTDSAIIGGLVGGSISGGLVGKTFRDVMRTPKEDLG